MALFDQAIVKGVAERSGFVAWVDEVHWMAAGDEKVNEFGVPGPGCIVQRRITVMGFRLRDGKAEVEHEANRFKVGVGFPAIDGQEFAIGGSQVGNDLRMLTGDGFSLVTAGEEAGNKQAGLRIAFFAKESKQARVAFEKSDLMRIGIEGKGPLEDGSAAAFVADGREGGQAPNAVGHAVWIQGDEVGSQIFIAESGGEKDVRSGAAVKQIARGIRSLANEPFSGRGGVVVIANIDVGTEIDEQAGGGKIAGEMERRAAIAALGVDEGWVGGEHVREDIGEAERGGGVDAEGRTVRDEQTSDGRRNVVGGEAAGPGFADFLREIGMFRSRASTAD